MQLHKQILTNNDCYKAGKTIKVKGLMLHSTGANNHYISRYVQPDDGVLGKNKHNNHWNQSGISKCVHGFIGRDTKGEVRTYQTLPWNHRGWHAGGAANDTHIGVEICEDGLDNREYFNAVYEEAVELFAYLCKTYGLTEKNIIDHAEGRKLGVASNHGDVGHWFPKFGKSMDTFRADVKKLLSGGSVHTQPMPNLPVDTPAKDIETLAQEVIAGKHGSGEARKKSLGDSYNEVQSRVNAILQSQSKPVDTKKSISQLADEVMRGMHGSGRERMLSLGKDYAAVQQEVNRRMTQ